MTGKIEFLLLPLGPYTNVGFGARSFPRASGGTPRFTSQIAIPTLRMRPDFRSWLRYKRATSATTFSRQKPVPSYDPAPVHPSFRPLFHRSPATKSPPMRPHFPSCFRYNRATNATTFSYEKLHHSYEFGRISYENAPSRPARPDTKCLRMRPPFRSWLRYNHETSQTAYRAGILPLAFSSSLW